MHGPTPLDRARDRLTREVLEDLYLERGLTSTDIGVVLGVDPGRVIEALHRHGIPVRTRGIRSTGGRAPLTKELLEELYVRQGLSLEAIAAKLGYTRGRVRLARDRHGIPPRRDWRRGVDVQRRGIPREVLEDLYVRRGLTMEEVGAEVGVSAYVVSRRLGEEGLSVRSGGPPGVVAAVPDVVLLERLYADSEVAAVLERRHSAQRGPRLDGSAVLRRRRARSHQALRGPLLGAGVSPAHIELLTGRSARAVREHLKA